MHVVSIDINTVCLAFNSNSEFVSFSSSIACYSIFGTEFIFFALHIVDSKFRIWACVVLHG
jgi:hypothetical protein